MDILAGLLGLLIVLALPLAVVAIAVGVIWMGRTERRGDREALANRDAILDGLFDGSSVVVHRRRRLGGGLPYEDVVAGGVEHGYRPVESVTTPDGDYVWTFAKVNDGEHASRTPQNQT